MKVRRRIIRIEIYELRPAIFSFSFQVICAITMLSLDHRVLSLVLNRDGQGLELERYSHRDYLIKVVAMALAREVTQELSPIRSWSNNNYEI